MSIALPSLSSNSVFCSWSGNDRIDASNRVRGEDGDDDSSTLRGNDCNGNPLDVPPARNSEMSVDMDVEADADTDADVP